MDLDPRAAVAYSVRVRRLFHIMVPAFAIGLAAWLATLEGTRLATAKPVYRRLFDFGAQNFATSSPQPCCPNPTSA